MIHLELLSGTRIKIFFSKVLTIKWIVNSKSQSEFVMLQGERLCVSQAVPSSSQRLDFAAATADAYYPLKSDAGLRPKNKDLHSFILWWHWQSAGCCSGGPAHLAGQSLLLLCPLPTPLLAS